MGVGAASGFSGRPERVGCRHRLIFNARGLGIIRQESSVSLVLRDWNMFVRQFKASILAYDFVSGNCLRFQIGPEKRCSVLQTAASALHRTAARRFEGLCALPNRIGRMNLTWQGRSGMKPKPALRSSGDCNQSPGTRGAKQSVEVPYGSVGATKLRSREMLTQC